MTISLNGLSLPADLEWQDEFDFTPVRQHQELTLTGALVIEEAKQIKGRPITLVGGPNACWVPRSTIEALYALAQAAGQTLTLNYHGATYTVVWRHQDGPILAKPVLRVMNPGPDHKYTLTLRLMEVS